MHTELKCPRCGTSIDVENVLSTEIEQRFQAKYQQQLQENLAGMEQERLKLQQEQLVFEERKKQENELFAQRLQKEKQKLESELQEQLRKSIAGDFEVKLKSLELSRQETEQKLRESQQKELEFLQKQQMLESREAELELTLQKKLQEEKLNLADQIRRQEQEKVKLQEQELLMKLKDVQIQLDEQKKLAEEMRRRAEQGSMQRQGEVQELLLEQILREHFPLDLIEEVGKGVEGADCIQQIRNSRNEPAGKIIYESKRTKAWQNAWVDKLKTDMRNQGADVAILVTQVFPKEMNQFGERDGIWICSFQEVAAVAQVLRGGILRLQEVMRSQENKGDKMQMLYDYLTGNEFRGQMEAIMEGFMSLRNGITKERVQMEKIWKEREKQLEKVLLNTSGLFGSVKGIAGASIADLPLLDGGMNDSSEEA